MSGRQYENESFNVLAAKIVKTTEFRNLLNSMVSGFLENWGEEGKIKSVLAKQARQMVERQRVTDKKSKFRKDLSSLLQDPEVTEHLKTQLPLLLKGLLDIAACMSDSLEDASEEVQQAFLNDLFTVLESDRIGSTLSSMARVVDKLHMDNPTLFSDKIVQVIGRTLENIDFGDLKTIFENSESDFKNLGTGINDLLFEYPAKLILMLSLIPGLSNHLLVYLQDLIKRFNDLPADIMTDLLISFFRDLDEKAAGRLLDNLSELIRQVHTGSALIGDAGNPQFSNELGRKSRAALDEVDMERLFKAANAMIDGKEALIKQLYDAGGRHPSFIGSVLTRRMNQRNSSVRLARQKLELLEDLSQEKAASVLTDWLSEWNAYEFAEWVNSVCAAANLLQQHKPDALKHAVTEFVNTLDLFEIQESVEWISSDLVNTLQPVIQTVVPVVVRDVIHCLESGTGENDEQIDEMRQALRKFILNEDGNHE